MTELLRRACAPTDLEVRGDGRTIVGIAVPFDTPTLVRDAGGASYTETFRRGAFARTIAERGPRRVKVLALHNDRALPLGRAEVLREDRNGLYAELRVSATQAGDEVLTLVRDAALDGLSVGFLPVRDERSGREVIRVEVKLSEISLVNFPAYADARVAGVRHDLSLHGGSTPLLTSARHAQRLADLIVLEL